jgi:hypothetical protein
VRNLYPQTNLVANATNAIANSSGFGTNATLYQQTVIASGGSLILSNGTASRALILNAALQITNEPDATLFNLSSLPIKNYTNSLTSIRTQSVSVGSVTGLNFGNGITGTVASSELRLGVSSLPSTGIWMGGAGNSVAITAPIYRYAQVSGNNGTSPSVTNTSVAQAVIANCTVTGMAFNSTTILLGTGTNITVAFQTNGVDAFTATLTGNASRKTCFAFGQSIAVTTNDTINIRWTCDGNVAGQNYSSSVSYTIP